ncbi:MAG: DUF3142 domain-containing protein [Verrucomicrobia bacterium]|nr:DUF3142 domain-containing protein [Verrucomicrobiota bacterium]
MRKRAVIFLKLFIVASVVLTVVLLWSRSERRVTGALQHEVYVWQRAWTQPVRSAISDHGTNFTALTVLKAEVSWQDKRPQVARVALDYPSLVKTRRPVGIALRIGPYSGPFTTNDSITTFLADLAASLVTEAQSNHLPLAELQIDFDSAASKLDGYRVWVEAIQRRVAPLPVTITALPSWLKSPAFERLAIVATNYVLQVHSLERPRSADAPFTLCDPRAASRAVERAGRIGVPFRVALPTYGYLLAFDVGGKFLGLAAEGPRPNWPADAQLREVHSDPIELAELVRDWTQNRPAALRGVIWYRLPVTTDKFNWRWPTLRAILESRLPREILRVESRRVEAGLMEISLVNDGELDISSRLAVEVRWSNARLVAGDGQQGFELVEQDVSAARFQTQPAFRRLPAGERLTMGWLRFDRDCEVQCEVKKF